MKTEVLVVFCVVLGTVLCADTTDHSMDPSYYQCPFRMFDAGMPVTEEDGSVRYCGTEDGITCPSWYFCAAGYEDGKSVCCHILGV